MKKTLLVIGVFLSVTVHAVSIPTYQQIQKLQAQVAVLSSQVAQVTNSIDRMTSSSELRIHLNTESTGRKPSDTDVYTNLLNSIQVAVTQTASVTTSVKFTTLDGEIVRLLIDMPTSTKEIPVQVAGGISGWTVQSVSLTPVVLRKGEKTDVYLVTDETPLH